MTRKTKPIKLTAEQKHLITFAMVAHKAAAEYLRDGRNDDYETWCRMRDARLVELCGVGWEQLADEAR